MEADADRIDDAVLALLQLTLHDPNRAWKSFDWDVTDRLHAKGFIESPRDKTQSIVLTADGLARSEALFKALFANKEDAGK